MPDKVYCNGQEVGLIETNKVDIQENLSSIKMRWNNKLTNCYNMFVFLDNIIEVDLSNFDFDISGSDGFIMQNMFAYCTNLAKLTMSNIFDSSKIKNVEGMFSSCKSLTSLDLSNFRLSSLIKSTKKMFYYCEKLVSLDLSKFDTSQVIDMENMFYKCYSLKYLNIQNFRTTNVKSMKGMFDSCYSIISLDLSHFDTSKVTLMDSIFHNCLDLQYLDISNFDTSKITNFKQMFSGCNSLTTLDLKSFDTRNAVDMEQMFNGCLKLISLDIKHFDTSSVTRMEKLFKNCALIESLDITNIRINSIKNMSYMFDGCDLLTSLDLSNFDTSIVNDMGNMFKGRKNLVSLDLSNFDTSLVINMKDMFNGCEKLKYLNISNFNVLNVNNTEQMFMDCYSLSSLDLSNFRAPNLINAERMFYNCKSLNSLNISNFIISSTINMISMFEGCSNLDYINFNSFSENENVDISNIFGGTPDDLIYCVNDVSKIPKIYSEITIKVCSFKDCDFEWEENKGSRLEAKKRSIAIFNDKCVLKRIKEISEEFILTDKIPDTTIYSYELTSNIESLKKKYTNLTFVELSEEKILNLKNNFGLNEDEKIYLLVIDSPSNDPMTATSFYDYKFILENGTELNISNINNEFSIDISIPIRNLDLAHFKYEENFMKEGYDIYDKKSDFYNDICSPAFIDDNDIIIKDRKNEIFPNNVTLCQNSCEYQGVSIEDKRIVCECNINRWNNKSNENKNYFPNEDEEKGNLLNYLLDNINYKPFKCLTLLFSFDNLKNNYGFYSQIIIIFIIIININ